MSPELEAELVAEFPQLFTGYHGDPMDTCMAFGCDVGDGWFTIIHSLCQKMMAEIARSPDLLGEVKFMQIKEKFGMLAVHVDFGDKPYNEPPETKPSVWDAVDRIYNLMHDAELESRNICEDCGSDDETVTTEGRAWIRTLCSQCREDQEVRLLQRRS